EFVEKLTGSPLKGGTARDTAFLVQALSDDSRLLSCAQFNELLLLMNKDRVESPFFCHFFGPECAIRDLPLGLERFRITAMLKYGNFLYAYRALSRIADEDDFRTELEGICIGGEPSGHELLVSPKKLLDVELIPRS